MQNIKCQSNKCCFKLTISDGKIIVFYKHLYYLPFTTEIQNTVKFKLLKSIAIGILVCSLYLINEL